MPRLTELERLVGPVTAPRRHATDCLRRCPAHLTAGRARLTYALTLPHMARSSWVALLSRSKLALISRSVPEGVSRWKHFVTIR